MRHKYLRLLTTVGIIFGSVNADAQYTSTAQLSAGNDTTLGCNVSCFTLQSSLTGVNATTSYALDSTLSYSGNYGFNITGATSVAAVDEIFSGAVNLPFNFCFYGNTYSQITIGTNGAINFGNTNAYQLNSGLFTSAIPSSEYPSATILAALQDLDITAGGDIEYSTSGTAPNRKFIINYYQVPQQGCTSQTTTFQVVLYETTNIIEIYIKDKPICSVQNSGASISGIQADSSSAIGIPGKNNTSWGGTNVNKAYRFVPNGSSVLSSVRLNDISGTLINTVSATGTGNQLTATFSGVCLTADSNTYVVSATYFHCNGDSTIISDTMTAHKTVIALPVPNSPIYYCQGATSPSQVSATGTSLLWYTTLTGGTGSSTAPTPSTGTSGTFKYYVSQTISGCESARDSVVVTVAPGGTGWNAQSNSPVCLNDTIYLWGATVPGASYTWTGPSSFLSYVAAPQDNSASYADSGDYYVTVSRAGCADFHDTVHVSVTAGPWISAVGLEHPTQCQGTDGKIKLYGLLNNTVYTSYVVLNGNTITGSFTTNGSGMLTITGLTAGFYSSVTVEHGGCGSNEAGPVILNAVLAPTVTSSSTDPNGCGPMADGTITLSGLLPFGDYTINYEWYGVPQTSILITADNNGDLIIPDLEGGIYTNITATRLGCTTDPEGPISLTIPPTPVVTPTTNAPICGGDTIFLYSASTISTVTWSWTGPNGYTSSVQNPVRPNSNTGMSGIYYLQATNTANFCVSEDSAIEVIVKPVPSTPVATSNSPLCTGQTLNLSASGSGVGVTYNWSGPSSFTSTSQYPTISNVTTANAGNYGVYASKDGCTSVGTATVNVVITTTPNIDSAQYSDPTTCSGTNGTITLYGLAASTTHTVTFDKNGTPQTPQSLTSNTSGVITISGLSAGTYANIIAALSSCSSNVIGPIVLTDPANPATPTVSNNGPLCSGQTLNLTASSSTSGVTYSWTGPGSYSSSLQNPSISNIQTTNAGTYSVVATINGCNSTAATTSVTVNQTPATPVASSNSPLCAGDTLDLTSTLVTGTYAWTGPNSFSSSAQDPSINGASTAATGNYIVTVSANGCTSVADTVAVVVNAVPAISGTSYTDPTTCLGADGTITLTGLVSGSTYTVNYSKNGTPQTPLSITANGSGNVVMTGLSSGSYSNITVTINTCESNTASTITLTDPAAPVITASNNGPVCEDETLSLTVTTVTGATYNWSGPSSYSSTNQNPNITNATPANSGTYTVIATVNNCSDTATTSATVYATPATPSITTNSPICSGNTLTLGTGSVSGGSYYWWGPNSFSSSTQNPSISNATTAATGTYNLSVSVDGCMSDTATASVTVHLTPYIDSTTFTNPTTCGGANGTISLHGLAASTTFSVNYDKNGTAQSGSVTTNTSGVGAITGLTQGTYTDFEVTANGCTSNTIAGPVVLTDPAAPVITAGNNGPICEDDTLSLTVTTVSGATYSWSGPSSYTSSTQNPNILNATPANSGTYTVIATVNNCSDTATTTATVNATPTTPAITTNSPVCSGDTLTLTTASVSGATYNWWGPNSFTSTTQNNSINNVTTAASGVYSLTTTVNGCVSDTGTATVVINATPNIASTSFTDPTTCMGADGTISLSGLNNNTTYTVDYSFNGTPQSAVTLTSNGSGVLTISGLSAGTYSNISVSLTACESNIVGPITLTDPAAPVITAGNNTPICETDTVQLTVTTVTGATYTWSGPGSYSSSTQNPSIPNATPTNNGTYTVIATVNNCSDTATTTVTVNATPTTPTAGSNSPVCSGNTINLTSSTVGSASYNWWGPNSFTSTTQNPSISNATTAASGTYYVIATENGCASDTGSTAVVVNLTPHIDSTTFTDPTTCTGSDGTITLHGLSASTTYTVDYDKNGTAQSQSVTTNGSGNGTITGLTAGSYTDFTATVNGCISNTIAGPVVLTDPAAPVITASNNTPICETDTVQLTVTTVTGATYTWSGPGSYSSTTQNPTIPNATPTNNGTYTVIATVNNCSDTATTTVTVNATPATPAAGSNSPVCSGDTLNLTAGTVSGATYNWWGPNSFTSTTQNPSINNVTIAAAGTYYVTATINGCPSDTGSTVVVVNPTPHIDSATFTNPTMCAGSDGTITLHGLTPSTTYTVDYAKNGTPQSQSVTTNGSGNGTVSGLTAGTYTNFTATLNACASNIIAGPITLTDPAAPVITASNNTPICETDTVQLTATTVTGATYTWSGPGSFSSTTQNPTIPNATPTNNGTYTVIATVNNCSDTATTVVTVNATPTTPTAGSNSPVCSGDTLNLTAGTVSGATYNWWGPNSFTSTIQNPSINNVTTAAAGTYYVTATVSGCPSDTGSTVVVINPTPHIDSATFTNPTMCAGSDGTITLYGLTASTTFTIDYEKNGTAQSQSVTTNGSGNGTITGLTAGVYTNFTAMLNACASNILAGPITLTDPSAPMPPTAGNNGPLCPGDTLLLTASTTSGATYYWWGPNSFTSTTQNPVILNAQAVNAGTYYVTMTVNNCTSDTATTTVIVNPTPATPTASSNSPVCEGDDINLSATTVTGATYSWTGPNSFTSNQQNPTVSNAQQVNAGDYILSVSINSCMSAGDTVNVVVNEKPVIADTAHTDPTTCGGSDGTITLIGLDTNVTYTVNYTYNGTAQTPGNITSNGSGNVVITGLGAGVYGAISVTLNGCTSDTVGIITIVSPPPISVTAGNNTPICEGDTIFLNVTTVTGATYSWTGPNGYTSTTQNPFITPTTAADSGYYYVTANALGCTSMDSTFVTIIAMPQTPTASSNSPVCEGSDINLSASTVGGATYSWTGPNSFTSNLQNPTINNASMMHAGTYVVSVSGNGCVSGSDSVDVVVNPTPVINDTAHTDPTTCLGTDGTITLFGLSATTTYDVSYQMNNTNVGPVSISSNGSGEVLIANLGAGTYDSIFVSINGCMSNYVGPITLVDPMAPPPPDASNNTPICEGDTILLFATSLSGATYSWSGPGGFTSTQQNPVILNGTSANAGAYTVSVTLNNCTSPVDTTIVVVNPIPATPTASSNSPLCEGEDINLTATTVTGTYSWTGPNAFTSSQQNPTIANAQMVNAGTYYVSVTDNGCTSGTDSVDVVVNPTPVIADTAHTDPTMCMGTDGTITLIGLDTNIAYTVTYTYNGTPQTASVTSDGSGNVILTGLSAGTYDTITVVLNPCSSLWVGPIVLTDPGAPAMPVASNNTPICEGDTVFLFASNVPGVTYNWTGPNSFTSSSQNPFIPNATSADAGTYMVSATLNNCTSATNSTVVVIDPSPTTPTASSNSPLCEGDTLFLNATTVSGATYTWTGPNSYTSSSQNPVIANTTTADAGWYYVTANIGACGSDTDSVNVIINPVPATPDASSNSPLCEGATLNLTATTVTGTYSWTGPNSFTSSQQNPSIPAVTVSDSGTYYVSVSSNGCTSGIDSVIVVIDTIPDMPVASANTPLCEGDTLYLTSSTVTGATYTWTGPNGFSSSLQNPVINGVTLADAGQYIVWATTGVAACASGADTVDVVVNPASVVSGYSYTDPTMCMGTDGTITLSGFIPGDTYSITYVLNGNPVTASVVADAFGNLVITGLGAGTYVGLQAATTAGCASTALANITLVDPNAPATPTAGSNSPVCEGDPINLTATLVTGATYNWTGPNSFTSNQQDPVIAVSTAADAGTYYVSVTANGCTSGVDSVTVVVNPVPTTPVINTNSPLCEGDAILLSATSTTGANFVWWGPNGFSSTSQNPTIPNATSADAGFYYVHADMGGCGSDTASALVIVNPTPAITSTSHTDPTMCNGTDGTITISGLSPGSAYDVTYDFNGNPQPTVSLTANGSGQVTVTGLSAGTYTGLAIATGPCGDTSAATIILVDPNAPAAPIVNNNGPLCEGDTLQLTANTVTGATYTWTGPGGFTSSSEDTSILNVTAANAGTYTLVVTVTGCNSAPATTTVTINPTPTAPVASSNSPLCEGSTLTLFATPVTGATYTWTGPNNFTDTAQNPVLTNAQAVNAGTYYVSANFGACGSTVASVQVVINPAPNPPGVVSPVVLCEDEIAAPLTASGQNLLWYTQSVGGTGSSTAPVPNTTVVGSTFYYVSQTVSGCESNRDSIEVIVNPKPVPPTVLTPINYCQGEPAAPLAAQGQNLLWYTQPVGGTGSATPPTPGTNTVGTTVYYVSQIVNGCESDRDSIVVNVLPGAQAPTVGGPAMYCQFGPVQPAITTFVAGNNLTWYTQQVGGVGSSTPPVISTNTVTTITYYISQGNGACESQRVPLVVVIIGKPQPPLTNDMVYCENTPAAQLTAQGQGLLWYTQQTGGTGTNMAPTPQTSVPGSTTWWVSQTVNGCESDRAPLTVVITPTPAAPVVTTPYNYCQNDPAVQLTPSGAGYLWYTTSTGGTGSPVAPTPSTSTPGVFQWWVSQNIEGCESYRAVVTVNVFAKPQPPATIPARYCQGDVAVPLTANGQNLKWYASHTGGNGNTNPPTPITTNPGVFTYYVSQMVNGCESDRTPLTVTIYQNVQAGLQLSKGTVCRKDTAKVVFTGPQVTGATYSWNFNGATIVSGSGMGPYVLSWNTSGMKIVTVTVTNGTCTDTETDTLTIVDAPDADFTMQDDACIGEEVKVHPVYNGFEQLEYFWDYGGAQVVSGSGANYHVLKWNTPGMKVVTLVVKGEHCPSQPFRDTIKIHENPIAKIESRIHYNICSGDTVTISAYYNTNYKYEWGPDRAFAENNSSPVVGARIEKPMFVYLTVYDDYGCSNMDSLFVNSQPCCNVWLPTAFTPNGDGKNDIYRLLGDGHIQLTTFAIRNRFGQVVFETANQYEAWDGRFNGQMCDVGTYFYYVRYKCGDKYVEKKGDVTLIR